MNIYENISTFNKLFYYANPQPSIKFILNPDVINYFKNNYIDEFYNNNREQLKLPYENLQIAFNKRLPEFNLNTTFNCICLTHVDIGSPDYCLGCYFYNIIDNYNDGYFICWFYNVIKNETEYIFNEIICRKNIKYFDDSDTKIIKIINTYNEYVNIILSIFNFKNIPLIKCSLNKKQTKRLNSNNLPIFEYKLLDINIPKKYPSAPTGIKHNSPRLHLRRGHVRHLKKYNIWIDPMLVGNIKKGIIHKDYTYNIK